jgi:hypothetical protein
MLKKETVSNLYSLDMKKAVGGAGTVFPYCIETYPPLCAETEWTCYTGPPMDCKEP